jgi:hypothetical protein
LLKLVNQGNKTKGINPKRTPKKLMIVPSKIKNANRNGNKYNPKRSIKNKTYK